MSSDPIAGAGEPPYDASPPAPAVRHGGVGDVDGAVRSIITDSRGAVHTGDGSQYVNNVQIASLLVSTVASAEASSTTTQQLGMKPVQASLEFLQRVFVEPPAFNTVREHLRSAKTVVLTGPPGSGRRTAAQLLLCPTPNDVAALTLLTSADLGGSERLTAGAVSEGERLLLDVSDLDSRGFAQCQNDLMNCMSIASRQRASLVILIPDTVDQHLQDDLLMHHRPIGRPDPWRVLASHLRYGFGLEISRSKVAKDDLSGLNRLPLRSVARVAVYLDQTRDQALTPADWFRNALAGLADQEQQVLSLLGELKTVEQRTILLSSAMLEAASADAIYFAEQALHHKLNFVPELQEHRLAQPGITDRLREVPDHIRLSEDSVRFVRPAFGEAVLNHFWDAYPDLRPLLARWVRTCPEWPAIQTEDRIAVATRFAVQAIRTSSLADLTFVAEDWVRVGRDETRRLAAEMMTRALLDDRTGPLARQYLYQQARNPKLTAALGRLVIELCRDVVAVGYSHQALIRLRWLADRDAVRSEAREAIVGLCADNRTLESFIHVLTDRDRFDPELGCHVLSPRRLAGGQVDLPPVLVPRLRDKAVEVWRRSLLPLDPAAWRTRIVPWLDEHLRLIESNDERSATALRQCLIEICAGRISRLAQLNTANEAWLALRGRAGSAQALTAAAAVEKAIARTFIDLPTNPLGKP